MNAATAQMTHDDNRPVGYAEIIPEQGVIQIKRNGTEQSAAPPELG